MLQVRDLVKTFGRGAARFTAVRGASFAVPAGSFFTLLGPSGCGKTTILRCVAGLENPDAGEIRVADEVVFSAAERRNVPPELRSVGMVFQSYAIWPHMSVFENAAFPLRHARPRVPEVEVRRRVLDMLERLGLGGHAQRWATQLSGGQQQRLALARALLREPALLLLDEPLSNLDAKLRQALRGELKAFQRRLGVTTLYVTHDQAEALALSDRIAVLRSGSIEQVGAPRELYDRPATRFVAGFVGDANFFTGPARAEGSLVRVSCDFGELTCTADGQAASGGTAAGGTAAVSIRPEDVRLATAAPEAGPNTFAGRVEAVEFVGESQGCIVRVGGTPVRARLHPRDAVAEGQQVWVSLPPDRCHLVLDGAADAEDERNAAGWPQAAARAAGAPAV